MKHNLHCLKYTSLSGRLVFDSLYRNCLDNTKTPFSTIKYGKHTHMHHTYTSHRYRSFFLETQKGNISVKNLYDWSLKNQNPTVKRNNPSVRKKFIMICLISVTKPSSRLTHWKIYFFYQHLIQCQFCERCFHI